MFTIIYKKDAIKILANIAKTDEEIQLIKKIEKGEADITDYITKFPCPISFVGFLVREFVVFPENEKKKWLNQQYSVDADEFKITAKDTEKTQQCSVDADEFKITAEDMEKMTNGQLFAFFRAPNYELREKISMEFLSEEERQKKYEVDRVAQQVARERGFCIRKFQDFDTKFIKRMVFLNIIPYYIEFMIGDGETSADMLRYYTKCSRSKCQNLATHYLYKVSGKRKNWWRATVKQEQYCQTCLDKIVSTM